MGRSGRCLRGEAFGPPFAGRGTLVVSDVVRDIHGIRGDTEVRRGVTHRVRGPCECPVRKSEDGRRPPGRVHHRSGLSSRGHIPPDALAIRRAVRAGDDRFRLHGHLRIKDIELPLGIDLPLKGGAHGQTGENHVGFVVTAALRRSDWGLNWDTPHGSRDVLTGDTVKLALDVSAMALERVA
ncbi:YceI family protein [Streptomyces sp. NPDC086010]|uniref:YceI family protein n=1 Tax=Streptomyces sp. NPDC086010 TaxID=3365745 RepID=UPI0037D555C8